MTGKKKKVIYLAALCGAMVMLLADRLLVVRPATAGAAAPVSNSADLTAPLPPAGAAARAVLALDDVCGRPPFPEDLHTADLAGEVRDPFALPPEAGGLEVDLGKTAGAASHDSGESSTSAAAFARRHELKGVFLTGEGAGTALIDDEAVDVGQTFDGATLIHISSSEAHFQCRGGVAVLTVAP